MTHEDYLSGVDGPISLAPSGSDASAVRGAADDRRETPDADCAVVPIRQSPARRQSARLIVVVGLLLAPIFLHSQEIVTLSAPEVVSNPNYHVSAFNMDVDNGVLSIVLRGVNGETLNCGYSASTTPTGASLIVGLNKANLSTAYAGNATTGSLKFRIWHHLVVMGESTQACGKTLTGTLAGSVP